MKTASLTITLKVKFEYDETRHLQEAAQCAKELAINPNMSSICEGVHLLDYETETEDYEMLTG